MKKTSCLVAFAAACSAFGLSSSAEAYNHDTHQRIVEAAVESMVDAPNAARPAFVDERTWALFGIRLQAAAQRLQKLRSGLPPVHKGSALTGLPFPAVGSYNDPTGCDYRSPAPLELNLLRAPTIRIEEFDYFPRKEWTPCAMVALPPRLGGALGPVLGWHGMDVDNRLSDSVLWYRPTNAFVWGLQRELANRVVEFLLGSLILPVMCIGDLLSGGSCDPDDAYDLAREVNPITLFEARSRDSARTPTRTTSAFGTSSTSGLRRTATTTCVACFTSRPVLRIQAPSTLRSWWGPISSDFR